MTTHPFLQNNVGFHLIHGNMARTFNHHLAAQFMPLLSQFAVNQQFLYHGSIEGIAKQERDRVEEELHSSSSLQPSQG